MKPARKALDRRPGAAIEPVDFLSWRLGGLLRFAYAPPSKVRDRSLPGPVLLRPPGAKQIKAHQEELRNLLGELAEAGAFSRNPDMERAERAIENLNTKMEDCGPRVPRVFFGSPQGKKGAPRGGILPWPMGEPASITAESLTPELAWSMFRFDNLHVLAQVLVSPIELIKCSNPRCKRVLPQRTGGKGRPRRACPGKCSKERIRIYEASEERRKARRENARLKRRLASGKKSGARHAE